MSMDAKSAVELMESSNEVNFSGFHMVGFEQRKDSIEQPTTSETDMYKQPFVIGVAGGAASGKTAVCDMIIQQLHDQRVVLVNQALYASCSIHDLNLLVFCFPLIFKEF
ncbi:uridine kinase [Vigna unguiculata]|uniref:Uridine kinase n=1 Tax=Vigna unguiculata TaxID=3917 RepID=A0A4D6KN58_VIGUN|nr:uridine kinase [Vigna unguiculata]